MIVAQSSEELLESARFHERLGYVLGAAAFVILVVGVILTLRGEKKKKRQSQQEDLEPQKSEQDT